MIGMKRRTSFIATVIAAVLGSLGEHRTRIGALALEVDAIDKVPESQRGWYVEKEGKFTLDLDKVTIEDVAGLKKALGSERDSAAAARREAAALAKKYEGIDPDAVKLLLSRFDGEEEAALIKAGKFDEVLKKRHEKMQEAHVRALADKDKAIETEVGRRKKYEQRVLDGHLIQAATKAGVHQHAMEDVMYRGRSMFTLDEEGEPVRLLEDGKTVEIGKDGKSPYSPVEWIEGTMKEKAPHWFPVQGSGGGTGGDNSRPGSGGKKQIKRADFDAITDPVRKSETAKTHAIVD